jgi:amidase
VEGRLWELGAGQLAELIRNKQVKSREVVEAHLARIDEVNPAINAVTLVLAEQALTAADQADGLTTSGVDLGSLHGVPITVKENIDVLDAGATTQGLPAMADDTPTLESPQVSQLKSAGAIVMGRTNLPDFGFRWHTDNELHGQTLNPWDPGRTPGGSSGGEAAALATGMTPLGLGNDYGGSLRWPSQCNGTCALKPTLGRVPAASSLMPQEPPISIQLFAVEGPMARHVSDLRLALEAMSGFDARDPWWVPARLDEDEEGGGRRVAVTVDPGGMGVDPQVRSGVQKAARALQDAGYLVDEVEPPAVAEASDLWANIVLTEVEVAFKPLLTPIASKGLLDFLNNNSGSVEILDLEGYMAAWGTRNAIARQWAQFFERYDLVLGPIFAMRPFEVGFDISGPEANQELLRTVRLTVICNLLGLPAAAVPVGTEEGLPQAVQLIGPRYHEMRCLAAAEALEGQVGRFTPVQPVMAPL